MVCKVLYRNRLIAPMAPPHRKHELSDQQWSVLEPLLPDQQTDGRHYRNHRTILNGILYWHPTGIPWRDLPERYGPWQTLTVP